MNIDLNELDFSNAGNWPLAIKLIAIVAVCAAVGFAGYWFDTKEQIAVLEKYKSKEEELKKEFETKQAVAANLEAGALPILCLRSRRHDAEHRAGVGGTGCATGRYSLRSLRARHAGPAKAAAR